MSKLQVGVSLPLSIIVSFVVPFMVLLNRPVKSKPIPMIILCIVVFIGIWLEHLLLLGPALSPQATSLPLGLGDVLITLGFLGLLVFAVTIFLRIFPVLNSARDQGPQQEVA